MPFGVRSWGNPLHVGLSGGQGNDLKVAKALIFRTINNQNKAVIADRGYGSSDFRECFFTDFAQSVLPGKSNSKDLKQHISFFFVVFLFLEKTIFVWWKNFGGISHRNMIKKESAAAGGGFFFCFFWLPLI